MRAKAFGSTKSTFVKQKQHKLITELLQRSRAFGRIGEITIPSHSHHHSSNENHNNNSSSSGTILSSTLITVSPPRPLADSSLLSPTIDRTSTISHSPRTRSIRKPNRTHHLHHNNNNNSLYPPNSDTILPSSLPSSYVNNSLKSQRQPNTTESMRNLTIACPRNSTKKEESSSSLMGEESFHTPYETISSSSSIPLPPYSGTISSSIYQHPSLLTNKENIKPYFVKNVRNELFSPLSPAFRLPSSSSSNETTDTRNVRSLNSVFQEENLNMDYYPSSSSFRSSILPCPSEEILPSSSSLQSTTTTTTGTTPSTTMLTTVPYPSNLGNTDTLRISLKTNEGTLYTHKEPRGKIKRKWECLYTADTAEEENKL